MPDLKFIGDEILVRTTCGAEVLEMSCGGLEGIKETMRIVTRWGENPNPKVGGVVVKLWRNSRWCGM